MKRDFIEIDFSFGAVGVTAALGHVAGKEHGGFTSIAPEIRAEIHAGPTADAEVSFLNIPYKRFGSIDPCHGDPSWFGCMVVSGGEPIIHL